MVVNIGVECVIVVDSVGDRPLVVCGCDSYCMIELWDVEVAAASLVSMLLLGSNPLDF